jgi:hypothetical protein
MSVMTDWYDVLFSITAGALTQQQKDDLAGLQANWVLLNARGGKWYVNILGPKTQLLAIESYLAAAGRNPVRIGVFQYAVLDDGTEVMNLVGQPNKLEYLAVAPDVITYTFDALGNVLTAIPSRPTAFVDVHRFAGWPPKNIP